MIPVLAMPLEPGQLVTPQVRLVRQLKAGGMGSVWVADQLGIKTQVAVKFIQGNHAHKPELAARFAREAMAAARIKSPHVVQIHDHGLTDAGDPYMVMELLDGEDLATRIRRDGPMRLEDVARVVQQVTRVLAKAHALEIVHRDIKPSNIFVVDGGEGDHEVFVKLLDFGVAKVKSEEESDLTGTGVMMGTMVYMSPEQLLDARNVDFRADLWSLAVASYYAIVGTRPFSDENGVGALILALDRGQYEPASKMRPGLPPAIDAWFSHAFKRKPEDRFTSAKEMANELLAAIGSPETMAMLQTSSTALQRMSVASLPEIILPPVEAAKTERRPRRAILFLALVAAAAGAIVAFLTLSDNARSSAASRPETPPASSSATSTSPGPSASASVVAEDPPTSSAAEAPGAEPTATAAPQPWPSNRGPLHGPRPKSTSEKDYGF